MEERIRQYQERQDKRTTGADADAAVVSSGEDSTDGDSEPDFEFEFPSLLCRDHGSPAPADDLFADGRIRPAAFYPVFGRRPAGAGVSAGAVDDGLATAAAPATERRTRGQLGRLFLEESRAWNSSSSSSTESTASTSSAATDDGLDGGGGLEGAAPESYCVWAPGGGGSSASARLPRAGKSGSTGSSVARWRRISDLVVGRSQSDGKEKFLFLPVNPPTPPSKNPSRPKPNPAAGSKKGVAPASEIGTVAAAHRMAYGTKAGVAPAGATPRRTFLPYREELVGFFANVNGISRSHAHPY